MGRNTKSSRSMGLWSAIAIGVGAMIGAGLFALIGIAADLGGRLAYLSFLFAGMVALVTTYSVAKLAVKYPREGGRVEYLNEAFGKGIFSGGLNTMMWIGYIIVTSLYAKAFGEYGVALLNLDHDLWVHVLSSVIVIIFVIINFLGASAVGNSEIIIVAVKVLVLVVFGVVGIFTADLDSLTHIDNINPQGLILASGVVFMSYEGFGLVANTAEDINDPEKNLPRALFISVLIVLIIYMLVSLAVFGNMPLDELVDAKKYALAEAARPLMGSFGFVLIGVTALFSTASAINATLYGPVYMLDETAKARQMPSWLSSGLFGHSSGVALITTGILILLVTNTLNLESIAETGSLIFLISYAGVNVANLKLKKKTKSSAWIIWLGIIGTSFSSIALAYYLIDRGNISIYLFTLILVCGYLFQWIYRRWSNSINNH